MLCLSPLTVVVFLLVCALQEQQVVHAVTRNDEPRIEPAHSKEPPSIHQIRDILMTHMNAEAGCLLASTCRDFRRFRQHFPAGSSRDDATARHLSHVVQGIVQDACSIPATCQPQSPSEVQATRDRLHRLLEETTGIVELEPTPALPSRFGWKSARAPPVPLSPLARTLEILRITSQILARTEEAHFHPKVIRECKQWVQERLQDARVSRNFPLLGTELCQHANRVWRVVQKELRSMPYAYFVRLQVDPNVQQRWVQSILNTLYGPLPVEARLRRWCKLFPQGSPKYDRGRPMLMRHVCASYLAWQEEYRGAENMLSLTGASQEEQDGEDNKELEVLEDALVVPRLPHGIVPPMERTIDALEQWRWAETQGLAQLRRITMRILILVTLVAILPGIGGWMTTFYRRDTLSDNWRTGMFAFFTSYLLQGIAYGIYFFRTQPLAAREGQRFITASALFPWPPPVLEEL